MDLQLQQGKTTRREGKKGHRSVFSAMNREVAADVGGEGKSSPAKTGINDEMLGGCERV